MVRVCYPRWTFSNSTLNSIDIHPDGSRFVSGLNASTANSARLTFWNMDCIRNRSSKQPKILCEKNIPHTSINCVRWSMTGHMLASAEDEYVVIWCYSKSIESSFGSKVSNYENWKVLRVMKGHHGNVFDLRWSPDDKYLASCSVDNKIFIWNARNFPELLKSLSGHNNFIKGLCWDPLGSFLASQSDDRTLRIWRTCDWGEEMKIWKPFTKHCFTHYLRCDWSPDGQSLVCANAVNREGPVAAILRRNEEFNVRTDFVGHSRPISCVRFHPRMIKMKDSNDVQCLLALASKDRSISLWMSSGSKAILTLYELVDEEIVDISWNPNSLELGVCSLRGKVAFVFFAVSEIGSFLSRKDQGDLLKRLYGDDICLNIPSVLVSDPDMFNILVRSRNYAGSDKENITSPPARINIKSTNASSDKLSGAPCNAAEAAVSNTQKEIRGKDGKRKIIPVSLDVLSHECDESEVAAPPPPFPFNIRQGKTTDDDIAMHNSSPDQHLTHNDATNVDNHNIISSFTLPSEQHSHSAPPVSVHSLKIKQFNSLQQSYSLLSSHKNKSIAPDHQVRSSSAALQSASPSTRGCSDIDTDAAGPVTLAESIVVAEDSESQKEDTELVKINPDAPASEDMNKAYKMSKVKKLKLNAIKTTTKGPSLFQSQGSKKKRLCIDEDDDEEDVEYDRKRQHSENSFDENSRNRLEDAEDMSFESGLLYSPIKVTEAAPVKDSLIYTESSGVITVKNNIHIGSMTPLLHKIDFKGTTQGGDMSIGQMFSQTFTDPVVCVSCSENIVAIACSDDSLYLFDHCGSLLHFPFILDASVAQVHTRKFVVMVITCELTISSWDLDTKKPIMVNYQLTNLFRSTHVKLQNAYIAENGNPIVVSTALKAYSFDRDFATWVLVHEPGWSFAKNSLSATDRRCSNSQQSFFMDKLSQQCYRGGAEATVVVDALRSSSAADHSIAHHLSLSATQSLICHSNWRFCQMQEKLALSVGSGPQFKKWFLNLITELTAIANENALRRKLDELLDDCAIPRIKSCPNSSSFSIASLGLDKKEILKDSLTIIGKNIENQKIFSEYNQILKEI